MSSVCRLLIEINVSVETIGLLPTVADNGDILRCFFRTTLLKLLSFHKFQTRYHVVSKSGRHRCHGKHPERVVLRAAAGGRARRGERRGAVLLAHAPAGEALPQPRHARQTGYSTGK